MTLIMIITTWLPETWVPVKNFLELLRELWGFNLFFLVSFLCLINLTFSHCILTHIQWHWWQQVYSGSVTPVAKRVPGSSLTCSSLKKMEQADRAPSLNQCAQKCLTFICRSRTVHFKDSFNSLSLCLCLSTLRRSRTTVSLIRSAHLHPSAYSVTHQ